MSDIFWNIDFPAFIIAALAGLSCSLCGALLLLKKETMIADAFSHSLLPGLALAYAVTGVISFGAMLVGAFLSCMAAAGLILLIRRTNILNENTALGVTLTGFFALGVILLETLVGSDVHLDTEHALYGALELVYWPDMSLATLPHQIPVLMLLCLTLTLFLVLRFQHLKTLLFDQEWARTIGIAGRRTDFQIIALTVCTVVACFEAVGVILVLALIVCPAAAARLLSNKLSAFIILSGALGMIAGLAGYYLGAILPLQIGLDFSLNAAGSIALSAGCMVLICYLVNGLKKGI